MTHPAPTHDHGAFDGPSVDLLDAEGHVHRDYWAETMTLLARQYDGPTPHRILDLGAGTGTGTGTLALADAFPTAQLIALDGAAPMLDRLADKIATRGEAALAARIQPLHADLDAGWPDLEPVDLIWASMALHHVADPEAVLRSMFSALRPGGLLAVAELGQPQRVLPDDLGIGRPGLSERMQALVDSHFAQLLPTLGSHWAPRIAAAGFEPLAEREVLIDVAVAPGSADADYVRRWLGQFAERVGAQLAEDDRVVLGQLLGDGAASVGQRDDLRVRGSRIVTVARRP